MRKQHSEAIKAIFAEGADPIEIAYEAIGAAVTGDWKPRPRLHTGVKLVLLANMATGLAIKHGARESSLFPVVIED